MVEIRVNSDRCILCKLCIEYCPAHAFILLNEKIKVDNGRCIECYGCVPLCPVRAITIEVSDVTLVDFAESRSKTLGDELHTNRKSQP